MRSLGSIDDDEEVGSLWKALLYQCLSKNKHRLREIHHQIKYLKMATTEILVSYLGRWQIQTQKLDNTTCAIADQHRWGTITTWLLLEFYKPVSSIINLNFTNVTHQKMVSNFQDLSREDSGDENAPL